MKWLSILLKHRMKQEQLLISEYSVFFTNIVGFQDGSVNVWLLNKRFNHHMGMKLLHVNSSN